MTIRGVLNLLLESFIAIVSGAVVFFSVRQFQGASDTMAMRIRIQEKQMFIESLQPQLLAARQQLQGQQERINRGFAISEKVGPAVLSDIQLVAEQPGAERLRQLLAKHRMQSPAERKLSAEEAPASSK